MIAVGCGPATDDAARTATRGPSAGHAIGAGPGGSRDSNSNGAPAGSGAQTPTAAPGIPQVDYNGGRVVSVPAVVTITSAGDPFESDLQRFDDLATTTAWWGAVSAGYCDAQRRCVGPGGGGGHVVVPPSSLSGTVADSHTGGASDMKAWLRARVAAGTLPPPRPDTLYVLYAPPGLEVEFDGMGRSCVDFDAYHNSVALPPADGAQPVLTPYVVSFRCDGYALPDVTAGASHELIEAATDPDVDETIGGVRAYTMRDPTWVDAFAGGEVADLCTDLANPGTSLVVEQGFYFQRSWSNGSIAAGHDPCVPAAGPYFNVVVPAASEAVSLAVGQSARIDLRPTADDPSLVWQVYAYDEQRASGDSPYLDLSTSAAAARDGSALTLTVTLTAAPPQGYASYFVVSKGAHATHVWPGLITAAD